ncbi:MAG TPA: hypothetical protein VFN22_14025 [Gemmatimonadales bacterium]|nr:hypothetical protein [Gemmatimonadales bacterium]
MGPGIPGGGDDGPAGPPLELGWRAGRGAGALAALVMPIATLAIVMGM